MNREELLKLIDDEVAQVIREPLKEPVIQRPVVSKPVYHEPVKRENDDLDEILFYGGKKDEHADI